MHSSFSHGRKTEPWSLTSQRACSKESLSGGKYLNSMFYFFFNISPFHWNMLKNTYSPFFCDVVNSILTKFCTPLQHTRNKYPLFIYKLPCFYDKERSSMLLSLGASGVSGDICSPRV